MSFTGVDQLRMYLRGIFERAFTDAVIAPESKVDRNVARLSKPAALEKKMYSSCIAGLEARP